MNLATISTIINRSFGKMLDNVLIVVTLLFLIVQMIVSCQLSFVVAKSKKKGGMVVTNFWFDSLPYFLMIFTAIFLTCAIKTNDTLLLMLPISLSMCFLFDMCIICLDDNRITIYYFLLQKEICKSVSDNGAFLVVEYGEKKKVIRLSKKKRKQMQFAIGNKGKKV